MELAELMQSFQESMKAAKKDSEAREARARILTENGERQEQMKNRYEMNSNDMNR